MNRANLSRLCWVALAAAAALVVPGLAQAPAEKQKEEPKKEAAKEVAKEAAKPAEGGPSAPVDPRSYRIGAEDVLQIRVWREAELSGPVVVRPDGRITLPLAGEVQAAGLTPEQLTAAVTEALTKFLNRPEVFISVQSVQSKKYYITGEVGRSGAVPLVTPTTVLEALSNAGGFRDYAKKNKIVIMRGNQRLKFNYNEVIQGKNLEQNVFLQHGDHIIVP